MGRMITARAVAVVLSLLASCAPVPPVFPVYRDTTAPISSKAVFDPVAYAGVWHEVARYPVPFEANCARATAEYSLRPQGDLSVLNICRNSDGSERSRIVGRANVVGPGRLKVQFDGIPFVSADYWVLWVDDGYRTAVVGAPDGKSGWILNRDPEIPTDRLNAARDVLEFNGYDLSQLMEIHP